MSIRKLVDAALTSDADLMELLGSQYWFEAGAVRGETPELPFVEYRWGVQTPAFKMDGTGPMSQILDIYFHDEPGNYSLNIVPLMAATRPVLLGAAGSQLGNTDLVGVNWEYDGPDSYDDGHRTAVRYSRYRLSGTGF